MLVDAAVKGVYGGSGVTVDWSAAAELAKKYPLLLAGGLTPENVADAIGRVTRSLPSGDRKQVRLRIPSETRAVMNNYDDTFTTGQRTSARNNAYDFSAKGGRALGDQYLNDNYSALERAPDGSTVSEIIDPAAKYGLRLTTFSAEIRCIQVYAPTGKNFVAIEPDFNFPDPYNRAWGSVNTGMVTLEPGQSVEWDVQLELFTP